MILIWSLNPRWNLPWHFNVYQHARLGLTFDPQRFDRILYNRIKRGTGWCELIVDPKIGYHGDGVPIAVNALMIIVYLSDSLCSVRQSVNERAK